MQLKASDNRNNDDFEDLNLNLTKSGDDLVRLRIRRLRLQR